MAGQGRLHNEGKRMMEYLKAHWKCIASGFAAGLIVAAMLLS